MNIYLDTETTGLQPPEDRIVEVAIVDDCGRTLLNSLVNPRRNVPAEASAIHGITNDMLSQAPSLDELLPDIERIIHGASATIIYNARYDTRFFPPELWKGVKVQCAMKRFARIMGEKNRFGRDRWHRLDKAASRAGHVWNGDPHRALADTLACRSVWQWCEHMEELTSGQDTFTA